MDHPTIHAARCALDYHNLDQMLAPMADDVDHLAAILADGEDDLAPAFRAALPAIGSCRRRVLTIAAALERLERAIGRVAEDTECRVGQKTLTLRGDPAADAPTGGPPPDTANAKTFDGSDGAD